MVKLDDLVITIATGSEKVFYADLQKKNNLNFRIFWPFYPQDIII